jgi:hypothetical protein
MYIVQLRFDDDSIGFVGPFRDRYDAEEYGESYPSQSLLGFFVIRLNQEDTCSCDRCLSLEEEWYFEDRI